MEKRRVVITGIGIVSPIGIGKDQFSESLRSGKSGISTIQNFDTSMFVSKKAGEIRDFNPSKFITTSGFRKMDKITRYAVSGAMMAINDSGIDVFKINEKNAGVILGSAFGGINSIHKFMNEIVQNGPQFANPFIFPSMAMNTPAGTIAKELSFKGINSTICTESSSGMSAIEYSYNMILNNKADIVVSGGAEELSFLVYGVVFARNDLSVAVDGSTEDSRPFDLKRNGFVLSEGACIFILEEYEHAKLRDANIYGEITAVSSNSISEKIVPSEVIAGTIKGTISGEIEHIASASNSNMKIDRWETEGIKSAFGKAAYKIPISASKSLIGESLGASGPFSLAAVLIGIKERFVPPTINYNDPDPLCDLDYVPNLAREKTFSRALVNSVSIDVISNWGNCVCLEIVKV